MSGCITPNITITSHMHAPAPDTSTRPHSAYIPSPPAINVCPHIVRQNEVSIQQHDAKLILGLNVRCETAYRYSYPPSPLQSLLISAPPSDGASLYKYKLCKTQGCQVASLLPLQSIVRSRIQQHLIRIFRQVLYTHIYPIYLAFYQPTFSRGVLY